MVSNIRKDYIEKIIAAVDEHIPIKHNDKINKVRGHLKVVLQELAKDLADEFRVGISAAFIRNEIDKQIIEDVITESEMSKESDAKAGEIVERILDSNGLKNTTAFNMIPTELIRQWKKDAREIIAENLIKYEKERLYVDDLIREGEAKGREEVFRRFTELAEKENTYDTFFMIRYVGKFDPNEPWTIKGKSIIKKGVTLKQALEAAEGAEG